MWSKSVMLFASCFPAVQSGLLAQDSSVTRTGDVTEPGICCVNEGVEGVGERRLVKFVRHQTPTGGSRTCIFSDFSRDGAFDVLVNPALLGKDKAAPRPRMLLYINDGKGSLTEQTETFSVPDRPGILSHAAQIPDRILRICSARHGVPPGAQPHLEGLYP